MNCFISDYIRFTVAKDVVLKNSAVTNAFYPDISIFPNTSSHTFCAIYSLEL